MISNRRANRPVRFVRAQLDASDGSAGVIGAEKRFRPFFRSYCVGVFRLFGSKKKSEKILDLCIDINLKRRYAPNMQENISNEELLETHGGEYKRWIVKFKSQSLKVVTALLVEKYNVKSRVRGGELRRKLNESK